MLFFGLLALALTLTGCTNIAWEIQQPNPAVKPTLKGRDCVDTYFGIGSGTATFANAMRRGIPVDGLFDPYNDTTGYTPIRAIHSARITASEFWIFGTYCLRVEGAP